MKNGVEKPFYDKKFHQWCIQYTTSGGGCGAVWGDTEEECVNRYENAIKEIIRPAIIDGAKWTDENPLRPTFIQP